LKNEKAFNVSRLGTYGKVVRMAFRVIDSETGKIRMDAGDITSLIAMIEELGDQYEVKQLDISYDEDEKKKQLP
jgi:hypothetical protein